MFISAFSVLSGLLKPVRVEAFIAVSCAQLILRTAITTSAANQSSSRREKAKHKKFIEPARACACAEAASTGGAEIVVEAVADGASQAKTILVGRFTGLSFTAQDAAAP